MEESGRTPPNTPRRFPDRLRTLAACILLCAPAFAAPRFLLQPQVQKVLPGMPLSRVDSLLGGNSSVGRYEWSQGKTAVVVHKYNLVLDHFVPDLALGGESTTRVMPYFVIYSLPARKVAHAGTYRAILESDSGRNSPALGAIFAKVVATDTSECLRLSVEGLLQYAQRNVGWKHPRWADRLTAFNVDKALAILADSLAHQAPTADHFRQLGTYHRIRAVLGREPGFQQAVEAYSRSLALDSNQFASAFQLGQTRLLAGNPDSAALALRLFSHVQRRAKGELKDRARWGIAVSQWRLGWSCRARLSLRDYLSVYPRDEGARLLEERLRRPGIVSLPGDTTCPSP